VEFIVRLKVIIQGELLEYPTGIMVHLLVNLSPKVPQSGFPEGFCQKRRVPRVEKNK
jgi:hypothetical protein